MDVELIFCILLYLLAQSLMSTDCGPITIPSSGSFFPLIVRMAVFFIRHSKPILQESVLCITVLCSVMFWQQTLATFLYTMKPGSSASCVPQSLQFEETEYSLKSWLCAISHLESRKVTLVMIITWNQQIQLQYLLNVVSK